MKTTYRPVMNPVLETVVRSSPAVWKRVSGGEEAAGKGAGGPARPRQRPERATTRHGASASPEIAKRTARKAKSG